MKHPAKRKYPAMGRRWGKSLAFGSVGLAVANYGGAVGWGVPTYKNARPAWRFAMSVIGPLGRAVAVNKSEMLISFPSGGWMGIYSMENPDALRGESLDLFIGDEAAKYRPDIVDEIVDPCLADRNGTAVLIGTPMGQNWYYHAWELANMDRTGYSAAFTAPTSANPLPNIQAAFLRASVRLPSRIFAQEWLAQFLPDGGSVFRGVSKCIVPTWRDENGIVRLELAGRKYPDIYPKFPMDPFPGQFVMSVDWARENDYTVIGVWDVKTRRLVDLDIFNQIDWALQRSRVANMWRKWKVQSGYAELNSMGETNVEELHKARIPIHGFYTSNLSKARIVEDLTLRIENRTIGYPDIPELGQLRAFTQERLPGGMIRYNAPSGIHDDFVIMAALGNHAMENYSGGQIRSF